MQAASTYRFDASLRFAQLPLLIGGEAALWRLKLRPSDVGWTAWSQAPGEERLYWPLSLGGGAPPAVSIVFRSSILVAALRVTVHEPANKTSSWRLPMVVDANEPIPYDLPPGPSGIVTVDVVAEGADSVSSEALSFRLWRPKL